jgi:hypothetical protein
VAVIKVLLSATSLRMQEAEGAFYRVMSAFHRPPLFTLLWVVEVVLVMKVSIKGVSRNLYYDVTIQHYLRNISIIYALISLSRYVARVNAVLMSNLRY